MIHKFVNSFVENLKTIIKEEATVDLINEILNYYDLELSGIAPESDPTAPEKWKDAFAELLYEDIERTFYFDGQKITFGLGNEEELGYTGELDPKSQDVLKTFCFIFEGILGEYAWITSDVYKLKFPDVEFDYGRFGKGFLIDKETFYKENWNKYVSFEEVRWGFSNSPPKDIFEMAYKDFDWSKYISKALEKTTQEFKSKI